MIEISINNVFNFLKYLKKTKIKIEFNLIGYENYIIINVNDYVIFNQKLINNLLIQNKFEIYWFADYEEMYQWGDFIIDESSLIHIIFIG